MPFIANWTLSKMVALVASAAIVPVVWKFCIRRFLTSALPPVKITYALLVVIVEVEPSKVRSLIFWLTSDAVPE